MKSRDDLVQWEGQSPPKDFNEAKVRAKRGTGLPSFGPYKEKKAEVGSPRHSPC